MSYPGYGAFYAGYDRAAQEIPDDINYLPVKSYLLPHKKQSPQTLLVDFRKNLNRKYLHKSSRNQSMSSIEALKQCIQRQYERERHHTANSATARAASSCVDKRLKKPYTKLATTAGLKQRSKSVDQARAATRTPNVMKKKSLGKFVSTVNSSISDTRVSTLHRKLPRDKFIPVTWPQKRDFSRSPSAETYTKSKGVDVKKRKTTNKITKKSQKNVATSQLSLSDRFGVLESTVKDFMHQSEERSKELLELGSLVKTTLTRLDALTNTVQELRDIVVHSNKPLDDERSISQEKAIPIASASSTTKLNKEEAYRNLIKIFETEQKTD